jgi:predicted AAA+ superfamily ATPase
VRLLEPFHANLKKRLVKSPKLYLRDSGLLHTLLRIETQADLWSHPIYGASWEGFAIEQILAANPRWTPSFCATHSGAEVDLILERGSKRVAVECKASSAPSVDSRFVRFVGELGVDRTWVVAPVDRRMPIANTMEVAPLHDVLAALAELAPR